jgi:DNA repair photolyase
MQHFDLINERTVCYDLANFSPVEITIDRLRGWGVDYPLTTAVQDELRAGSAWYAALFRQRTLTPEKQYEPILCDPDEELEIHNYTGICPTNVLEVSPSAGSCAAGCQYCLVTDGQHVRGIRLFANYCQKLANSLVRNRERRLYYYFSPKTEAFSETHLCNGMAHDILRTFIAHFQTYPDTNIRLFIATKAGPAHLSVRHKGETLFDLLEQIGDKAQVNGSVGIMPPYLRNILEPNVADIAGRLEALRECRRRGVFAESVLCQPLFLPYLTRESVTEYMVALAEAGVKNIKPEFFTAEIKNLVLVAQYIHHYDPERLGAFFYPYLQADNLTHIKQRARLAPDRRVCAEKLALIREIAMQHGITVSLCNWVKREVGSVAGWVREIDRDSAAAGYRCLGYQTRIFRQEGNHQNNQSL